MTDDIVTQLEKDLFIAIKYANSTALSELLERALNVVRVAEQRRKRVDHMTDEIERLRNALAEQTIIHEVQKTNTLNEIEYLRRCLQHAIDHVGKWGLFTAEEKQAVLAEYEQAVRGE